MGSLTTADYFWPWIFPSDVVPFQSNKEVASWCAFFGPWTKQENGSSFLCDIISVYHLHKEQTNRET